MVDLRYWLLLGAAAGVAAVDNQIEGPRSKEILLATENSGFDLASSTRTIYLTEGFANQKDAGGLTLVPPTAYEFAQVLQGELAEVTGAEWSIEVVESFPDDQPGSVFLDAYQGDVTGLAYESGRPSEEAYQLVVNGSGMFVLGTGVRGMFWGTRTLLQEIILYEGAVPNETYSFAPAYPTRGFMLDAGRKWYSPSFLKELCTYASFWKINEFHYHLSDNYPLSRGHNETWQRVYSQFSLLPETEDLRGLIERPNETLSRAEFEDFQGHCAKRGITVIPEIDAPGHCLFLTKWKPELALSTSKDLLNLTHPDTAPTVKRIWAEFLPWFQTKEVHIGADEYDASLADDYVNFVNDISKFVQETSGKRVRIWGTNEPAQNLSISKDVIVQHWQYGESDPLELTEAGYDIINSDDWWAYMSLKSDHMPILPKRYPQFFNESRVLNFSDVEDWQWTPEDVNYINASLQLDPTDVHLKGAILAAWNDNGPDATTQLEAYYALRRGIALVGSRSWSGSRGSKIEPAKYFDNTVDLLTPQIPGQNLERRIKGVNSSTTGPLVSWERQPNDGKSVKLGWGSKGMNYTLTLNITGPFTLTGPDNELSLDSAGNLVFTTDGWPYPLRSVSENDALVLDPGHPGRIWTNATSSTHDPVQFKSCNFPSIFTIATDVLGGTRVWVNGRFKGRFEVFVFGGKNTQFSWNQMAFVAPLDTVAGGVQSLVVEGTVKIPKANGTAAAVEDSLNRRLASLR